MVPCPLITSVIIPEVHFATSGNILPIAFIDDALFAIG
jgi:hypothetical protein